MRGTYKDGVEKGNVQQAAHKSATEIPDKVLWRNTETLLQGEIILLCLPTLAEALTQNDQRGRANSTLDSEDRDY